MRVFITGITGFIGGALAERLVARGHDVCGSTTRAAGDARWPAVPYCLGEPIDATHFESIDAVVHTAHDLARGAQQRNVSGTVALADAAAAAGARLQVYVSSYSAHDHAVTEYARTKRELEGRLGARGIITVRPGLVVGRGGLFGRWINEVRTRRVVPVIYPDAIVPVVSIGDLVASVARILEQHVSGVHRLHLDDPVTMRQLVRAMCAAANRRAIAMPVAYPVARACLAVTDALGVTLPATSDALRALRANQRAFTPGDLAAFVDAPQTLEAMVRDAC